MPQREPGGVIETVIRDRRAPLSDLCATCSASRRGEINRFCSWNHRSRRPRRAFRLSFVYRPRARLEPRGEPSARQSGGAVFILVLEIHCCPPCDPQIKATLRQTACQSLRRINCGIFPRPCSSQLEAVLSCGQTNSLNDFLLGGLRLHLFCLLPKQQQQQKGMTYFQHDCHHCDSCSSL